MKTYAVQVTATVSITYYVQAESEDDARCLYVAPDELVYQDSHGGVSPRHGVTIRLMEDSFEWEESSAEEAEGDNHVIVATQDEDEEGE